VKYGWIAFVAMMVALLSAGQVAAQYAGDDKDEPPPQAPEEEEAPMSELDKLKAMEAESETPTVVGGAGQTQGNGSGLRDAHRRRCPTGQRKLAGQSW
jgi:hypothetical protein